MSRSTLSAVAAQVAPPPRGGSIEHQLYSQWSCRCDRFKGGGRELRSRLDGRIRRFCHEIGRLYQKESDTYDHRCLFVFPHGLIPPGEQLGEFDAIPDPDLLDANVGSRLAEPYVLIGLEVVYAAADLVGFSQRCQDEGGSHLGLEGWSAALRFRKELRHLHEHPDSLKGVILESRPGLPAVYSWSPKERGHGTQFFWDLRKLGSSDSGWMRPWYHHRVPLEIVS